MQEFGGNLSIGWSVGMVRLSMTSNSRFTHFRWLILAVCLCVLLLPNQVQAQGQVHFSSAKIYLLPEYDQPKTLVLTQLTLASDTALPVSLKLSIPAKAQIWAVAVADSTGALVDAAYTTKTQADRTELSFASDSLTVHVEYYDTLVKNGAARHIEYDWPGDYAVDALTVDFQQPVGATNLVLIPPSVSTTTEQGFTHYQTGAVSLKAGQTFRLTADYQRQTDSLSSPTAQAPASATLPKNQLNQFWSTNQLSLLLGVLGGLLVVGALASLVFWQRNHPSAPQRKRHARPVLAEKPLEDKVVFCSQCGNPAKPGDVFCRACGARLRRID